MLLFFYLTAFHDRKLQEFRDIWLMNLAGSVQRRRGDEAVPLPPWHLNKIYYLLLFQHSKHMSFKLFFSNITL